MITKEDWAKIEKAVGTGIYGSATLLIDGHRIMFKRGLVSKNKLGIGTFVDGAFKGEWCGIKNEHPEQRYMREEGRFYYSAKQRAEIKKLSFRVRKMYGYLPGEAEKKVVVYTLFWPSVSAIRKQYEAKFSSIELLETVGA